MKLLVLSDSHGEMERMIEAIELEKPDYVIHLGDHVRDADELRRLYPMLPIVGVRGNCDYGSDEEELRLAEYGGIRVLMAHGHKYGVKSDLMRYFMAAKENQVEIALFGHTHFAYCEEADGIWMVNPGSCGPTYFPTYAVIEIEQKKPSCFIRGFGH